MGFRDLFRSRPWRGQILKPNLVWETVNNYSGIDGSSADAETFARLPYNSYVETSYGGIFDVQRLPRHDLCRSIRENIDGTLHA